MANLFIKQGKPIGGGGVAGKDYWIGTIAEWNALSLAEKAKWDGKMVITVDESLYSIIGNNAGSHNSLYRGKFLGSSVSASQYAQIQAGTFDDLFIGDYWTIGGVNYRIAGFDYWLHCGDTECTDHHVVLVPDTCFTAQKMNDTNITDGGYVGSKMYTTYLADAKSEIDTAFGSSHILTHRELLTNTVASGIATNWSWYDSTVELMNETMVYGCTCGSKPVTDSIDFNIGIDKTQLPLFALEPSRITNRAYWWLRSVVSASVFAFVGDGGGARANNASAALGVRPCFAIKGGE